MRVLRWFLLSVLGFLFFITLLAFVFGRVARNDLTKASFYKDTFNSANVYERIYTEVLPKVTSAQSFYGGLQLSGDDSAAILRQVFPPEFIRQQTERDLDNIEAYLRGRSDDVDLAVDLRPGKAKVPGAVNDYLNKRIDTAPVCTPSQSYDLGSFQSSLQKGVIPPCVPQGLDRTQLKQLAGPIIAPFVQTSLNKASDVWDPVAQAAKNDGKSRTEYLAQFEGARNAVKFATGAGYVLLLVVMLVIIGLVALLRWGNRKHVMRAIGAMLFAAALPLLIVALAFRASAPAQVHDNIMNNGSADITAALQLAADVAQNAVQRVGSTALGLPLVVFIVGVVLFVGSFFVGKGGSKAKA